MQVIHLSVRIVQLTGEIYGIIMIKLNELNYWYISRHKVCVFSSKFIFRENLQGGRLFWSVLLLEVLVSCTRSVVSCRS